MKRYISAVLSLLLVCCASALLASCSGEKTTETPPTQIASRLAEVDAFDAAAELRRPKDGGFTLAENGMTEYAAALPDGVGVSCAARRVFRGRPPVDDGRGISGDRRVGSGFAK